MPVIEIGAKNFIAGESSADYVSDRGFSPTSSHLNLTKKRGVMYFAPTSTDMGGVTLTGAMVASCFDPSVLPTIDIYYVDDEAAFYTLDGVTFTKQQTGGNSYSLGTTDLIPFMGSVYATSTTAVAQLGDQFGSIIENWWSGLTSGYRHPMEVIEDELFIGNSNTIFFWNGTSSGTAFTLPTGVGITSLRRHPDGRTLLAFCGDVAQNASHTEPGNGRVYYCDPLIRDWTREVAIESQVEGTRVVGGVVHVCYGKNFGYFDGNGLVPLKRFDTSATTYSHSMGNIEDTIIFRDGTNVIAYGDLGAGDVFYKIFQNTQGVNNVQYQGDNVLLVAYASGDLLKQLDYDNAGATGEFFSNRYAFPDEVRINRIDIIHDRTDTAGTTAFTVNYRDLIESDVVIQSISYVSQDIVKTRIECDVKTDIFQLHITGVTDDIGFKHIRIFYEPLT